MPEQVCVTQVCVTIVTFNSSRFIEQCLESVFQQRGCGYEVVVVDNASSDGTPAILARYAGRIRIIQNSRNVGFAAGQNQAMAGSDSSWVLALNPDVVLKEGFIAGLVAAGQLDPRAGSVCGKLLSIAADLRPPSEDRIDSAGMVFTPEFRHFDRGWGELAAGLYDHTEYVVGASAAAALYRREMIDDISQDGAFFDPLFFAYREDADVAWRAQLMAWRCLYTPVAQAYHVRTLVAGNRKAVPAVLNMHSVKNRFLMRIKNVTPGLYRQFWLTATARDLLVIGGCLLVEPRSLPAFWRIAANFRQVWRQRGEIMRRRRDGDETMAGWFSTGTPGAQKTKPLPGVSLAEAPGSGLGGVLLD